MLQKGPGEGYYAAKDEALSINPNLECRRLMYNGIYHYRIFDGGVDVRCASSSSRESWNLILGKLKDASKDTRRDEYNDPTRSR